MSLSFVILCGKCFRVVPSNSSGSVLSCGDILCSTCNTLPFNANSACPACGKEGVKSVNLNDQQLPEEVSRNLTDPSKELESIHEVLVFQVKYYKQIMKRLLLRVNKSEQECENYKRMIMDLENRMLNKSSDYRPSFSSDGNRAMTTQHGSIMSTMNTGGIAMTSPSHVPYKGAVQIESSPTVEHSGGGGENAGRNRVVTFQTTSQNDGEGSVLGKRNNADAAPQVDRDQYQQQHFKSQQHQQQISPRMVGLTTPQHQHQQQQQQVRPSVGQYGGMHSQSSSLLNSPQHGSISAGSGRVVSTPTRLQPFTVNRPISAMGRNTQSPSTPSHGPSASRLRSPHVPLIRSPALPMSPNKSVNVAQSDHQMAHNIQMQQYQAQQQKQQQQSVSLEQFIGE